MAFDPERYRATVIGPLSTVGVGDIACTARYAIDTEMTADQLHDHLAEVRRWWHQHAGAGDRTAQACAALQIADEDLQRTSGALLHDPAWWTRQRRLDDEAAQRMLPTLISALRSDCATTRYATPAQREQILVRLPSVPAEQITAALADAGLTIREPVRLPDTSGLDATVYERLTGKLRELDVPTIVQLIHPDLKRPFALVDGFAVDGDPERSLAPDTIQARLSEADSGDSQAIRARVTALGILLAPRLDVPNLALYQLAERCRAHRDAGAAVLLRDVESAGLTEAEARLIVFSILAEFATIGPDGPLAAVRERLDTGRLRAAERAVDVIQPGTAEGDRARTIVAMASAEWDQLVHDADAAVGDGRESDAELLLTRATRMAQDDDGVRARLAALAMPPAGHPVVEPDGFAARLHWTAATSIATDVRYTVVRSAERPPASIGDGDVVAETGDLTAIDPAPPVAAELHYAVFTTASGRPASTRPGTATVRILPPVTGVVVAAKTDGVAVSWTVHAQASRVRVRRSTESGTDVEIAAGGSGFTDVNVRRGETYRYAITAFYFVAGSEIAAGDVVVTAHPQLPSTAVQLGSVTLVDLDDDTMNVRIVWRTQPDDDVQIWEHTDLPDTWHAGSVVGVAALDGYGHEVAGERAHQDDLTVLTARVPRGTTSFIPIVAAAGQAILGHPFRFSPVPPVGALTVRPFRDQAVVSWHWPESITNAEVVWAYEQATPQTLTVTKSRYTTDGGLRFARGPEAVTVTVRAVLLGRDGTSVMSLPATASLRGLVRIRYRFRRPPRGLTPVLGQLGRRWRLAVTANTDTSIDLVVRYSPGPQLPSAADDFRPVASGGSPPIVATFDNVALVAGVEHELAFDAPVHAGWIRCLAPDATWADIEDPRVDNMKLP